MIGKIFIPKSIQRAIVTRMVLECQGRIAFNTRQTNRDNAKLAEYRSKSSLNFLQRRDMAEREGRIRFNEKQLARDRSSLEELEEELRRLQE
jgi:hypothetical protein